MINDGESMTGKETSLGELLAAELEPVAAGNRKTVKGFYKALASNDTETISRVVASDLEWWFHGPPNCQHMMRTLTGKLNPSEFKFKPRNITAFADRVIVEGWRGSDGHQAYWAHVWTLEDGIMTQLREYFDTWLTVFVRFRFRMVVVMMIMILKFGCGRVGLRSSGTALCRMFCCPSEF